MADIERLPGSPTEDYELNVLLCKLSSELEEEDLVKMKFVYSGADGITKRIKEQIKNPLDFFEYMKQTQQLSRYNLLHLQSLMWHIHRKDLFKTLATYAQGLSNMLHLFAPKPEPENGFKHIKFHVGGEKDCSRADLLKLQTVVSQLMFVPPEFVYVVGIEPGGSLIITLMVPESNLEFLFDIGDGAKTVLQDLHVECIHYEERTIQFSEDQSPPEPLLITEAHRLYEKNAILTRDSATLNCDLISLKQKQEELKKRLAELTEELLSIKQQPGLELMVPLLMNVVYELYRLQKTPGSFVVTNMKTESLRKQSARAYYFSLLKKVRTESENANLDLIYRLLEAHHMVTVDAYRDQQLVSIKAIDSLLQMLVVKLADLQRENEELSVPFHLVEVDVNTSKVLLEHHIDIRIEVGYALSRVSQKLRPRDRANLLKEVPWAESDKEFLAKNYDKYLLMVFIKECVEKGDFSMNGLYETLERINRKDLCPKIEEYIKEYRANMNARVKAQRMSASVTKVGNIKEQERQERQERRKHRIGDDARKGSSEQQKESREASTQDGDIEELRMMVKENNDMIKMLIGKQSPFSGYPHKTIYDNLFSGVSDLTSSFGNIFRKTFGKDTEHAQC
ncbi:hypothetical protein ScPMuIL_012008 [Solemya velum]